MSEIVFDIETTGLNPLESRITCISAKIDANEIISCCEEDEKLILQWFFTIVADDDTLVSFNGNNFDIPFIVKRCIINNVKMTHNISLDIARVINCAALTAKSIDYGSLNFWSKILLGTEKMENGEKCIDYFKNKEYDKLRKHNEEDVRITKILLDKLRELRILP